MLLVQPILIPSLKVYIHEGAKDVKVNIGTEMSIKIWCHTPGCQTSPSPKVEREKFFFVPVQCLEKLSGV